MKLPKLLALVLCLLLLFPLAAQAQEATVQVHHLMIRLTDINTLHVEEHIVLENTLEAPQGPIALSLPQGYENLVVQEASEVEAQIQDGGKLLIPALPPGESSLKFHYDISSGEAPHFLLTRELSLPTQAFFVMVERGVLAVSSGQLVDAGPMTMGEIDWQIYQLAQQEDLKEVQLVIHPVFDESQPSNAAGAGSNTGAWERFLNQLPFKGVTALLFLVLAIILPIMAVGSYWNQRRSKEASQKDLGEGYQRLLVEEKILKEKLVELEQNYAQGAVDKEEYELTLEVLKKKLIDVRAQLKSFTD